MIVAIAAAISISSVLSTPYTKQATKQSTAVSAQKSVISPAELFKKTSPYIVTIKTEDTTGTGFISPNGYIYTAHHVIEGKKNIKAVFPDKREIPLGWVVAMNPAQDWVAFQSLESSKLTFSTSTSQEVGSKVVVIGSPRGLEQTITEGLMSGKRTVGQTSLLQVSAAVSPGSSGSPLFNDQGDVIGLVSSKLGESEQLTFAVPISEFYNRVGVPISSLILAESSDSEITDADAFKQAYIGWILRKQNDLDSVTNSLTGLGSLQVKVYLNDGAKVHVSESELKSFITTLLGIHCSRLTIVSSDEAKDLHNAISEFDAKNPFQMIVRDFMEWDALTRSLVISIDSLNGDPTSCYTISTSVRRGTVGWTGREFSNVFDEGTFGKFGSLVNIKETWKSTLTEHIYKFADLWNKANKDKK
jgi:S1-C subfamily serine protease